MNRRKFLQSIGKGAAVAVVAPLAIAEALRPEIPYGVKVAQEIDSEWRNSSTIMRDSFKVTGSELQNVTWVKHEHGYQWYYEEEMKNRKLLEDRMERLLLDHGNHSLSSFLRKTGRSI